jgi:CubicO group peptidase (beta-lactamase class C family)
MSPAQSRPTLEQFLEQFDTQMKQGVADDEPGIVIAVARGSEVLFRRAYGKASLELDVDLTPEHAFCIASATKPFTATAVMVLVEDGALRLEDTATDLLEDVDLDRRVTIEHLLSHTSGLPDLFDIEGFGDGAQHKAITPDDLCAAADEAELLFEPGTQHRYSNLGYALLGRIVEIKSGASLDSFLEDRVFTPAGMENTMFGGDRRIVPGAVCDYVEADDGEWRRAQPLNYSWGFGLGGLFSTVDDLVAFDAALRDGRILEPDTISRMEQAFVLPGGEPARHGLGWVITERRGLRFVHHGGGIRGWRSNIVAIPEREVFVAVLSNRGEERTPVASLGMMVAAQVAAMPDRSADPRPADP